VARYAVAGRPFACQFCQGQEFTDREIKLNTTGLTFFDLDWLNKAAEGLICENCGYVHMFLKKGAVEEQS
jgi:predicted nucleic-acid-binding Zn-ribbon protein